MPTVRHSARYAFSESIMKTIVCSENVEERIDGIGLFVKIRGPGNEKLQTGNKNVRARKLQKSTLMEQRSSSLWAGLTPISLFLPAV